MSNGDHLMEEWEEFKAFERFQATRPAPAPEPEPVNPHLAYAQGPAGQTINDWKAFGSNATPEQLEIHSTYPDKRDNRDPEQVWNEILEQREKMHRMHGGFKAVDELAGQMAFDTGHEIDYGGPVEDLGTVYSAIRTCWQGDPHSAHLWTEDRPGGKTFWCQGTPPST